MLFPPQPTFFYKKAGYSKPSVSCILNVSHSLALEPRPVRLLCKNLYKTGHGPQPDDPAGGPGDSVGKMCCPFRPSILSLFPCVSEPFSVEEALGIPRVFIMTPQDGFYREKQPKHGLS